MFSNDEFSGMTALVTGASNGIGAETAVGLGSRGAHTIIHYGSDDASASAVLDRIKAAGGAGEVVKADFSSAEGVRSLITRLNRPVDILVNNAGSLVQRTKILDFTDELWLQVFMLNLHSAFMITRAVLPSMTERKRGVIVNVSSVAARHGGGVGATAYAAAKAAMNAMTKGLAKEFASQGIRVNGISPGTVETNFHRRFSTRQMLDAAAAATPMGRLGNSAEVADTILFLCTDAAKFIQGQTIEVNGGFLMV
jgi:3-oxoacyl-[acyl-carrier protein] reductase